MADSNVGAGSRWEEPPPRHSVEEDCDIGRSFQRAIIVTLSDCAYRWPVIQNHFELKSQTLYIGHPFYKLQAHGDHNEPISFRNIWVRELN